MDDQQTIRELLEKAKRDPLSLTEDERATVKRIIRESPKAREAAYAKKRADMEGSPLPFITSVRTTESAAPGTTDTGVS